MGNSQIGPFDHQELIFLQKTWQDMADRYDGKGIDKTTFLKWVALPGLLGERMFQCFLDEHEDTIDYDKFVNGLGIACRGNEEEKKKFLFKMLDHHRSNKITREELTTFLNQVPQKDKQILHKNDANLVLRRKNSVSPPRSEAKAEKLEHVDEFTNNTVVDDAFTDCDFKGLGYLDEDEFKYWLGGNPGLLEFILSHVEGILPYLYQKKVEVEDGIRIDGNGHKFLNNATPSSKNNSTKIGNAFFGNGSIDRSLSFAEDLNYIGNCNASTDHNFSAMALLVQAFKIADSESLRSDIAAVIEAHQSHKTLVQELSHQANDEKFEQLRMNDYIENAVSAQGSTERKDREGYIFKEGNFFHTMKKRYYRLKKSCLYYFSDEDDNSPKGVIFLTGSIVMKVTIEQQENRGYFAFEIKHQDLLAGEDHKHEHRILYCQSSKDRDEWVYDLQHAANVVPVEEDYYIGNEIARGRFSIVYEAVHKEDRIHRAIKRIDKNTIQEEEKELLRTEIVVLKLMKHPNIITLCGLYESKDNLDIAMEYMPGGCLLANIQNKPKFEERVAASLIRSLLEAIAYIHDLGIVHRDIKPDNILCGSTLQDIKVADFGLSKMILPDEKLTTPCGTVSYVAPEVLLLQGYGKECDMWAVGVILFILLCGRLPFPGERAEEILAAQISNVPILTKLEKVSPKPWSTLSEDAKLFISQLLCINPAERLTARAALRHPFILGSIGKAVTMEPAP